MTSPASVKSIAIVGAGGFAREVAWLIREIDPEGTRFRFTGFLVPDAGAVESAGPSAPVFVESEVLDDPSRRPDALALGMGDPASRRRLAADLRRRYPEVAWPALVHPGVRYDRASCRIGDGALVCAGVILTVNVRIEPFALLNLSCTVGHEAVVGEGSVLNPSVNISGGVTVGAGTLIGTGAQVLQDLEIGEGAVVGAGAVVTRSLPAGVTAVGIPAKVRGQG